MLLVRYDRTITSRQFNYLDNTTKKAFVPAKKQRIVYSVTNTPGFGWQRPVARIQQLKDILRYLAYLHLAWLAEDLQTKQNE